MLPPRCSSPPCMNIAVNSVSQVGEVGAGQPWAPTCSPGWVTSNGITAWSTRLQK